MARDTCEACAETVEIGGGISGIWSSDPERTGGMTLEFEDGSEHFLCFSCIEALPDEPTAEDVSDLQSE